MKLEKVLSLFLAALCLCSILSISASAEEISPIEAPEIIAEYAIARNPISALTINQNTATCTSSVDGLDCVHISATQTLQRYSGWFWSWDDVNDASWSKTVNMNSIWMSNSKSSLSSGTYRLRTDFSLTSSNGSTETITIYSNEVTI